MPAEFQGLTRRVSSERSEESRSAAQGKLREGSRPEHFYSNARFFLRDAQDRLPLLRMTAPMSFSAAGKAPPLPTRGEKSRVNLPIRREGRRVRGETSECPGE